MALIISQNEDCTIINLKSDLLDNMFGTPDPTPYDNIKINIFYNCCECDNFEVEITRDIPASFPVIPAEGDAYEYNLGTLLMELNPIIQGLNFTTWQDGVYRIVITVSDTTGNDVQTEQNCFFLDCKTSCKVAKHLNNLLLKEEDTELHLLHFGLTNSNNCNCNCNEMCYLYKKLVGILDDGTTCLCCKDC